MDSLSAHAKRVVKYLYEEKNPCLRAAGSISISLALTREEWHKVSGELHQKQLMTSHGEWGFKLTIKGIKWFEDSKKQVINIYGDVAPGASVGSGQVIADKISGRDIIVGSERKSDPAA